MAQKITNTKLRKLNLIAAGLHFAQGIAVLVISKSFSAPITGTYLKFDKATQHLNPATKTLFNIQLSW